MGTAKDEFSFSDLMHGGGEMKERSLDVLNKMAEELEKRGREVNALTAKEEWWNPFAAAHHVVHGAAHILHHTIHGVSMAAHGLLVGDEEMKKRSLDVLNKMAEELEKRAKEVNALTAKEEWWNPFAVLHHVVHGAAHILHHTIHGVSMAVHGLAVGDEEMKKKSLDVLNKMAEGL